VWVPWLIGRRIRLRTARVSHITTKRLLAVSLAVVVAVAGVVAYQALTSRRAAVSALENWPAANWRGNAATISVPEYWPTAGWRSETPEACGVDSARLAQGLAAVLQGHIGLHGYLVVRCGYLIADAYRYPYDGSIYHDLASVTKSVMTTLIGIAADQGRLDLDQTVLSFFPDRTIANRDARKARITVRHLLAMSSGLRWDSAADEESQLLASPDWVQFGLDLPARSEPGTAFVYSSSGMHLLSAILTEVTGMTALEFARVHLFEPLGITEVHWRSDPQGYTRGWGDLSMFPHDVAKLGFLFLHHGAWEGRQIVSSEWVDQATSRRISTGGSQYGEYGYGWWVSPKGEELAYFLAAGRNGQRVLVVPALDLVLVTTAQSDSAFEEVTPGLMAALRSLSAPLPESPGGIAQLDMVIEQLRQAPPAQPAALPEIARSVSGRTYVFEPNPAGIESIRLDFSFNAPAAVAVAIKVAGEHETRTGEIGLDGNYRTNRDGLPWIGRGSWVDSRTLVVEMSEGPGLNGYTGALRFEGDEVTYEAAGLVKVEGRAK
jgi:CubicO group peptidase (beta-lactamase class C family)